MLVSTEALADTMGLTLPVNTQIDFVGETGVLAKNPDGKPVFQSEGLSGLLTDYDLELIAAFDAFLSSHRPITSVVSEASSSPHIRQIPFTLGLETGLALRSFAFPHMIPDPDRVKEDYEPGHFQTLRHKGQIRFFTNRSLSGRGLVLTEDDQPGLEFLEHGFRLASGHYQEELSFSTGLGAAFRNVINADRARLKSELAIIRRARTSRVAEVMFTAGLLRSFEGEPLLVEEATHQVPYSPWKPRSPQS